VFDTFLSFHIIFLNDNFLHKSSPNSLIINLIFITNQKLILVINQEFNPYRKFKLKGQNIIFKCDLDYQRSVILKEGILDGILEVFVLC
jgi:hypothetical protein